MLWRISESLLEEGSALGALGSQQAENAAGAGPLISDLIALAEDLVLQASAALRPFLVACQSFPAGWHFHRHPKYCQL